MSVCSCYRDRENWLHERGVCYGTKECEPCSCGGDESKCDFYPEKRKTKPQTNADRIRSMTDEDLASLLSVSDCCDCVLDLFNACPKDESGDCHAAILDWLKKEVTEHSTT